MPIAKSYRLLQELNRPRGKTFRRMLGLTAYVASLGASGVHELAGEVRSQVEQGRIKDGLRFAHWLLRRGWLGLTIFDDPMYQLPPDLGERTRTALLRFARQRAQRRGSVEALIDVLDVLARNGHAALRASDQKAFEEWLGSFGVQTNSVLGALAASRKRAPKPRARGIKRFSAADASAALKDFDAAMADAEPWFVISGTFLGVVRDGGWLAHDFDIDVGIAAEACDFGALATRLAETSSFAIGAVHHQEVIERNPTGYSVRTLPVMIKLVHRTGINLDVFIHYYEDGTRWHGSAMHRWNNDDFALANYDLGGMPVLGPADPDRYLTENYGDWRVPVTNFSGTIDTPNLGVARNLMSIALMLRKAAYLGSLASPQHDLLLRRLKEMKLVEDRDGRSEFSREFLG